VKLTSLSVCAVGLLAGALSAATVTSNVTCSAEQVDGSTNTISHPTGCSLMDPETAMASAEIVHNYTVQNGFLSLTADVQSFQTAGDFARSGEALAEISFSDLFATDGPPRLGLIRYRFHAVSIGGDLTGQAGARVQFGSVVDFEIGSSDFNNPIVRTEESGGLVPFQLGTNLAIELTLQASARTFFITDDIKSLAESASIQIEREFEFFESDGTTGVNIVAAHPEVPEPQTYALAGLGLSFILLRRLLVRH
jgi:hypothetical protein